MSEVEAPEGTSGLPPSIPIRIGRAWLGTDGIVRIEFGPSDQHTLEDGHEVVDAHNRLADQAGVTKVPVLADIRNVKVGADHEARNFYVSEKAAARKAAMAMLTAAMLQKMLGNFFFRVNRPPYPSRMFSDEADALDWLGQFIA